MYSMMKELIDLQYDDDNDDDDDDDDYYEDMAAAQALVRLVYGGGLMWDTAVVVAARQAVFKDYMDYLRRVHSQHCAACIKDFLEQMMET